MSRKVAIVANTSWYIFNFRRNLIKVLMAVGYEVLAIAPFDDYSLKLKQDGISYRHFQMSRGGIGPLAELKSIIALRKIIREEKVNIVLSYTPKGNIYSGFSISGSSVKLISNISGLGQSFIKRSWLTQVLRQLYSMSLRRAELVFFQNEDDKRLFIDGRLIDGRKAERLPGSGVDLEYFSPAIPEEKSQNNETVFLLVARLIWDKGIGEFAQAAMVIRGLHKNVRFQVLGPLDDSNPSAIPRSQIDAWVDGGLIEYLGTTDDVRPYIRNATCVVLPSYREGVPRSLLEAAAMAKPIITTDAPGCRDVVDDGISGFLCQPRNAADLITKMQCFLSLGTAERIHMGMMGRRKMEREFSEEVVIKLYLDSIKSLYSLN